MQSSLKAHPAAKVKGDKHAAEPVVAADGDLAGDVPMENNDSEEAHVDGGMPAAEDDAFAADGDGGDANVGSADVGDEFGDGSVVDSSSAHVDHDVGISSEENGVGVISASAGELGRDGVDSTIADVTANDAGGLESDLAPGDVTGDCGDKLTPEDAKEVDDAELLDYEEVDPA